MTWNPWNETDDIVFQGARLNESNFINNTSMVFGQCLRVWKLYLFCYYIILLTLGFAMMGKHAFYIYLNNNPTFPLLSAICKSQALLEHQKNRSKPLPKHYKNSLVVLIANAYHVFRSIRIFSSILYSWLLKPLLFWPADQIYAKLSGRQEEDDVGMHSTVFLDLCFYIIFCSFFYCHCIADSHSITFWILQILTVRPGLDDYFDTSFLLRQASPFTKIKWGFL